MAQLIDTSVFIELERRRQPPDALRGVVTGEPPAMSAITAAALLLGVERADSLARRRQRQQYVDAILATVPIVPFDLTVARVHAQVAAALFATGQPIGPHDLPSAAAALAYGHSVLTHNLREFARVPGLTVRQPRW